MLPKEQKKTNQGEIGRNQKIALFEEGTNAVKLISDEYLIQQEFIKSPTKGFELLFRKYYQNLCNQAIRFVYAKQVAEDIVSEVFAQFWQKSIFNDIKTSYRSYLYTAVRNRAYNYIKHELNKTAREPNSLESIPISNTKSSLLKPDEILQLQELTTKIDRVIQKLPKQSRKAFQLHRLEGKKYSEIAKELDITVSAVERLISRALSKLKEQLKTEWTA